MAGRQGTDFDDVKGGGREKKSRPDDKVDVYKFPEKKWVTLRVVGKVFAYAGYWITGKSKDGKEIRYYVECPSFDPATQERDSTIYDPWRDAEAKLRQKAEAEGKNRQQIKLPIQFSRTFWVNAIDRNAQRKFDADTNKPTKLERTTGFKDKDSDTLTPCVAVRLPTSLANKIRDLKELNTIESKTGEVKSFPVSHEKYGCDIRVMYDSTKSPAEQYQAVPREKKTPLTEEEKAYLQWDLSDLGSPDSEEGTRSNFERWAASMGFKISSKAKAKDEDEDDDDDAPKSKKKTPPAKGKKKPADDEDFDDDDEDDGLDDDDDDEPPAKKKAPAKGKKKPVDDDEDEDEDDDADEDEDDDDEPPAKSKKSVAKPAAKGKKKPADDEDDDFDDEDDDEDDEDDEPPAKSKKAPAKGKKKPVDDDEDDDFDDEDDEDEDEDEDDEPPAKSKKKPAAKAPAKGKKKPVDDDEDEDDDFDDEDDEDDEPPAKSKKAPAKAPVKGKKKPVDDDEDEDEDEDDDFDEDDEDDDEPPAKKKPATKRR